MWMCWYLMGHKCDNDEENTSYKKYFCGFILQQDECTKKADQSSLANDTLQIMIDVYNISWKKHHVWNLSRTKQFCSRGVDTVLYFFTRGTNFIGFLQQNNTSHHDAWVSPKLHKWLLVWFVVSIFTTDVIVVYIIMKDSERLSF